MDVLEIPYEQLIEIGLNVLGYLVAATLGMVVYSMFHRRRADAPAVAASTGHAVQANIAAPTAEAVEGRRSINYVDLRRSDASEPNGDMAGAVSRSSSTARRDRAEIMRLAREMMKAKTPPEMIKRTLPISDGELALLHGGDAR